MYESQRHIFRQKRSFSETKRDLIKGKCSQVVMVGGMGGTNAPP